MVLSHQVWTRRFGARTDLVGQAITLNGEPYTVIGVMPEGFRYPDGTELWTLFQFEPASQEGGNYFEVVGRLKPGVTMESAQRRDAECGRELPPAVPETDGRA